MAGRPRNHTCASCLNRNEVGGGACFRLPVGRNAGHAPHKKMVPSDLISSLGSLPACTALSTANKSAGRFASLLPKGRFLQPLDQCFLARRLPPLARNRSPVTAFCSPATAAASRRPPFRGQSSQPATSLPSKSLPCPFGLSAPLPHSPVCAGCGRFTASGPLHFHYPVQPAALAISTPLRDFCLPRDQSVQPLLLPAGPPDESARFPLAPRRPFRLKLGLRITVPGPLRFRRLAVPQTSWNLIHYAPPTLLRQRFLCSDQHFSSALILFIFNCLWMMRSASPVYKSYPRCLDFAIL
jgi:hypothetical protein